MNKNAFFKNYGFLCFMLIGMILGSIVGATWSGATVFKPLGTIFINIMFCLVVPMVFTSIAGAVANMGSRKRAGKIMLTTIATFFITGGIACCIIMLFLKIFPPVLTPWQGLQAVDISESASIADLIVNFLTASDFVGLLSRRAMLPLIVFSVLFGFGVNLNGGKDTPTAKWLDDLSAVIIRMVKIVTYYAPIAFFGFFADLVATYGAMITADYGRALLLYYPLCFVYVVTMFPIMAYFGGGKGAVKVMLKNIIRPALTALGTCSSVATIPTNMDVAKETGIPKDVSEIVLPLGATMHMDGSCFSCALKIFFLFGVFGIPVEGIDVYLLVIVVAVLSSVGMSGVPGGGYVGEFIMCSVFFPQHIELAYPIAVVIGNLVDPAATMINAAGDYVVSFVVARFSDGKDWFQKSQMLKK